MSKTYIAAGLRRLVEERANYRCEYCLLPSDLSFFPHEIDHVIAEEHGGRTVSENLALTCWRCNRHKGSDLGSFDPQTDDPQTEEFRFLFNPRTQRWDDHFLPDGPQVNGRTPEGRTTVNLLRLNTDERLAERKRLSS